MESRTLSKNVKTRLAALAWSRALRDPKGENQLWVFGAERTRKSVSFNTKKNAQTLPKHLQNNFEKVQKSTFSTPKMDKNDPSNQPKWAKFWPKMSVLKVIYRPLKLKIHQKVGPLRPKTKPKHFPNKSKTTLKKSRNRLFWTPKWSKMTPQIGQNEQIFDPKFLLLGSFNNL